MRFVDRVPNGHHRQISSNKACDETQLPYQERAPWLEAVEAEERLMSSDLLPLLGRAVATEADLMDKCKASCMRCPICEACIAHGD